MYLNILIFILLFGLVQGVLILAVLLVQKKIRLFHILLSAYIAVMLLQVIFKVISKLWLMETWLQAYLLSYFLPFLYGPLIFLFAGSYLEKDFKWKWQYTLHFIPFLFYLSFYAFANPREYPSAVIIFLLDPSTRFILQVISLVVYHVFVFRLLQHAIGRIEINNLLKIKTRFLKRFSIASLIITLLIASTLFFLYTNFPNYQYIRWVFTLLTIFIYWLSYEGLKKPELFKIIYGRSGIDDQTFAIPKLVAYHQPVKYSNSVLKEDEIARISSVLIKSMDDDKIYLDANLNIEKLALLISCQRHHLSQVLNERFNLSFTEFINQKRITEAKIFLSNANFNHLKIASIAYDSGFNSLSSFNEIFKKLEGTTPSKFRLFSQQQNQPRIHRV